MEAQSTSSEQLQWTTVTGKSQKKASKHKIGPATARALAAVELKRNQSATKMKLVDDDEAEITRLVSQLTDQANAFNREESYSSSISGMVASSLRSFHLERKPCRFGKVFALGIGSVTDNVNAQWQFSFLLFLRDCLRKDDIEDERPSLDVVCYDPAMTSVDIAICSHFGIEVMTENNKGFIEDRDLMNNESADNSFTSYEGGLILLYMPHCPYRLYCNVIWSFWHRISSVFLLGNSFQSYAIRRGTDITRYASIPSSRGKTKHRKQKNPAERLHLQSSGSTEEVSLDVSDPTDSVALITPILHEEALPTTLHTAQDGHFAARSPLKSSDESLPPSSKSPSSVPLHILESAFCELSAMYLPVLTTVCEEENTEVSPHRSIKLQREILSRSRPSRQVLLEATASDVEIF